MEYGYGFYWPPRGMPYWVTPDGDRVYCMVENKVPLLPSDGNSVPLAPAMVDLNVESRALCESTRPLDLCTASALGSGKCLPGNRETASGQCLSYTVDGERLPV